MMPQVGASDNEWDLWVDRGRLRGGLRLMMSYLRHVDQELNDALRGIIDIGKRDTTNIKYDSYYDEARAILDVTNRMKCP